MNPTEAEYTGFVAEPSVIVAAASAVKAAEQVSGGRAEALTLAPTLRTADGTARGYDYTVTVRLPGGGS